MYFSKLFHDRILREQNNVPKNRQEYPREWVDILFKEYKRFPYVELPNVSELPLSLSEALRRRRSADVMESNVLSLSELSHLLYFSAGTRGKVRLFKGAGQDDLNQSRRFYPSGGSLYPLEVYVVIYTGPLRGSYHYNVRDHTLERLFEECVVPSIQQELRVSVSEGMAATIFISTTFSRNYQKYKNTGYRLALLEAGHLGQNICLVSTALNLQSRPFIDFHSMQVHALLDLDEDERIIYAVALG